MNRYLNRSCEDSDNDYTDHSMRADESGLCASIIIQD